LLMFPSIDYREKQEILTRARTTQLEHEKLRKEIEKKEILLHCIVHDLAGPMHGIQGALDLFAMSEVDEENRHLLRLCGRQCEAQQRLIQDILSAFSAEVASPKTSAIDPEKAPDALQAFYNVRDTLGPSFEMRGVKLKIVNVIHEEVARRIAIDPDSLNRALINLTENALRHSPRGKSVVLTLKALDNELLMTVDDEGEGVPEEIRDRLFNKFSQGNDRASRGKIGLGLYFCRITAETWGGEVGQENRSQGGSKFWIRLPKSI
jgi:signal transduction histidine kinase